MSKYKIKYLFKYDHGEFEKEDIEDTNNGLCDGFLFVSVIYNPNNDPDKYGVSIMPSFYDGRTGNVMRTRDKFSVWALLTGILLDSEDLTEPQRHILSTAHNYSKTLATGKPTGVEPTGGKLEDE